MDATHTSASFVEQFHLLFLAQLARRVKPALFVLKGGCNLRFFHKSVRYSEDMDLDLGEIGAGAFRDKVRELLASRPFAQILEARGVGIERVSEPKQTDTTQRWKLGLRVQGSSLALPTKIECSRRGLEDGVVLGSVDLIVARAYARTVDFGTFKSQVLAYLEPEAQPQYDSVSAWDTIVLEVVEALRGA